MFTRAITHTVSRWARASGFSLALLAGVMAGCATPPQVLEQSTAATDLYAQVDQTFATWHEAVRSELERRDRQIQIFAVRDGQAKLSTAEDPGGSDPALNHWLGQALSSFRGEIEWLRISHGIVDRFLRIDVIDLDEVKAVTERARDLAEASGGGS